MKIHHLRNATCVIETSRAHILIDPMLCDQGKLPPFSMFRFKAKRNPLVPLPQNSNRILEGVTHCCITHSQTFGIKALQHTDHLDAKGEAFLVKRNIPVITRAEDAPYLRKFGIRVEHELNYWQPQSFEGGTIMAVPAKHGHGWNHHLMANGAGYYITIEGEPSLYIGGDTVYTKDVKRLLTDYKPDISLVAAGSAQLDIGPPILMSLDEIISFIRDAPGTVILNHLEALNHCPTTRQQLVEIFQKHGLSDKAMIPEDGETVQV
ncbi:MAG: MBL fold metallo-hydrolase [Desulfobulbaceae bacterium]|nr:MAG: MBL fold metallo-hydrolase [Desulfobulbaceae bacterium]